MPEWRPDNRVILARTDSAWANVRAEALRGPAADFLRAAAGPVALVVPDRTAALRAVALLVTAEDDALVIGRERLSPAVATLLAENGFAIGDLATGEYRPATTAACRIPGRVWLLTSGSTGTPKLIPHRWETLITARGLQEAEARRWLVPYQVGTYAWYQLITLGLFQANQTLVIPASDEPESLFAEAVAARVDSLSATPTFWRVACFRVPECVLRKVPFKHIALGGEVADQSILDRLAGLFPQAQISHVYASTEAGTCIVVKDGRAGFPRGFLERNAPGLPALRIEEGRLWVRSPYSTRAAVGEPDAWLDSGDLVEVREDRVYFVGRANTALINVGGNKAFPADIETVLLAHPAVRWCRVRAVRSPLVGHLPEADLVLASGMAPDDAELTRYCAAQLPEYAVPRFWNRLAEIPVQQSLKSSL